MEYIKKFKFIPEEYDYKYSRLMTIFRCETSIESFEKMNINDIRKYAKTAGKDLYRLIDELTLRGFEFYSENPKSILPNFKVESDEFIYIKENSFNYKNINFKALGLGDFCKIFFIENDLFFNYIPIYAFKYFNSNIDIEFLKRVFLENNFLIFEKDVVQKDIENNEGKIFNETIELLNDEYFKVYLRNNGIKKISEIVNINKNELLLLKSFGPVRIRKIERDLENYNIKLNVKNNFNSNGMIKIKDLKLSNNFIKYCKKKHYMYLKGLEHVDFIPLKAAGNMELNDIECILKYTNKEDSISEDKDFSSELLGYINNFRFNLSHNIIVSEMLKHNINTIEELKKWDYLYLYEYELTPKVVEEISEFLKSVNYEFHNMISPIYKHINIKELEKQKSKNLVNYMEKNGFQNIDELEDKNLLDVLEVNVKKTNTELMKYFIKDYKSEKNIIESSFEEINGLNIFEIDFIKLFQEVELDRFKAIIESLDIIYSKNNLSLFLYQRLSKIKKENSDFEILEERINEGKTLQEIAETRGLTRERIRQKECKIVGILLTQYISFIIPFIIKYYKENVYLNLYNLMEIYPEDDAKLIYFLLKEKNSPKYKYCKELDIILFKNFDIIAKYNELLMELGDTFILEDSEEQIEEFFDNNDIKLPFKLFDKYLKTQKYKFIGNIVCKMGTNTELFPFLVKKYFKNGVRTDNEGICEFVSVVEDKLGKNYSYSKEPHAIKSLFDRKLIFCDTNRYTVIDNVVLDRSLIREIKKYLDLLLKDREIVSSTALYEKFESELKYKTSIDSPNYLSSILKYYYEDDFKFYRSTYEKNTCDNSTRVEKIEEYIFNRHDFVNIKEIEYKFVNINWNNILAMSDKLVYSSETKEIAHVELFNINDNFLNKLKGYIDDSMEYEILSVYALYEKYKLDFYERKIITPTFLFNIIKIYFEEEYNYSGMYILNKNLAVENFSSDYIIKAYFGNRKIIERQDILEFIETQKFRDSVGYNMLEKIINYYYKIDIDKYVQIDIPKNVEEIKVIVSNWLNEKLSNSDFIVLNNYVAEMSVLKKINDISWNEYSMESFVNKFLNEEFIAIKKDNQDWRYSTPIIVKKDSGIQLYRDVIVCIIKSMKKNVFHSNELVNELIKRGIKIKKVPSELYDSPNVLYKDNYIYFKE